MFTCVVRRGGEPLHRNALHAWSRELRQLAQAPLISHQAGAFTAIAASGGARPLLASHRGYAAAGDIRIDNRAAIEALAGGMVTGESDLGLLLRAYAAQGEDVIGRISGDFAVVIWDAPAQKIVAARDAFGVKPLYMMQRRGEVTFSSHTAALRHDGRFDLEYMAAFVSGQPAATQRTIWAEVQSIAAGGVLVQRGTVARQRLHWSPEAFAPRGGSATDADVERFHELLVEAVRVQMAKPQETWAHLSGGLDSSTIAAIAVREGGGLGGTLTVVDTLGAGDERAFSDAVTAELGVRNEQVVDYWAWQDDGIAPPRLDQPWPLYPFYARDRRVRNVVRSGGARVVLAGVGADHYLTGNLGYIRDLLAQGQRRRALTELVTWAAGTRQSFWSLAHRLVTRPALAAALKRPAVNIETPDWLRPGVARLAHDRAVIERSAAGRAFASGVAREMRALPAWIERYGYGNDVELRYPFLYRPLVEFALMLPADGRIRSLRTKWVLREAMRGTLPERVRTRSSKGGIDARVLWSLRHESRRVEALLRESALADLGVICADTLRVAVQRAGVGICPNPVHLMSTLALETWLAVHAGSAVMAPNAASHAA